MVNVYSPSDPDRPDLVELAIDTLGNLARNQILRHIAINPETYFGKIRQAAPGINPNTLSRHLRHLENAGLVTVDLPPAERKGRSPRYTTNPDQLAILFNAWFLYLNASLSPTRPIT
ncbi:helix-turn-helix transcriptional regulator (plasmid) [Leifsonia sp. ZF2019]|uniref:ArsR/SmtB family transcription factor n=1 Tax=Leifsonia sp. ZF2019 TaxID=2781978 RepID=UPI001CBDA484|nr:helix-turn-helix transcriptional regulator [Leifsonia sp. ZF2019]UAJ81759.1 helix-turn-helix transcriptional regulator [Leifsonia sp. ZF2019]